MIYKIFEVLLELLKYCCLKATCFKKQLKLSAFPHQMNQLPQQITKEDVTTSQKILPAMVKGKRINDSDDHQRRKEDLRLKKEHGKPGLCEFAMPIDNRASYPDQIPLHGLDFRDNNILGEYTLLLKKFLSIEDIQKT